MAGAPRKVVVWEWQEDDGSWIPYSPKNSNKIEETCRSFKTGGTHTLSIGIYVPVLKYELMYTVNVKEKHQRNPVTDKERMIKRNVLATTSALGKGVTWEWEKGGHKLKFWASYSTELIDEIETMHQTGKAKFKFPRKFNLPYSIDFARHEQVNLNSGYHRRIRRENLKDRYLLDDSRSPSSVHGAGHAAHMQNGFSPAVNSSVTPSSTPFGVYPHSSTSTYPASGYSTGHSLSSGFSSTFNHQSLNPTSPSSASSSSFGASSSGIGASSSGFGASSSLLGQNAVNSQSPNQLYPSLPSGVDLYGPSHSSLPTTQASSSALQGNSSNIPVPAPRASSLAKKSKKWKSRPVQWKPCPPGGIQCSSKGSSNVPVSQAMASHTKKVDVDSSSTDQCSICQYQLTEESGFGNTEEAVELRLCNHVFHRECVETNYSHGVQDGCIVCPSCQKSHGVKTGNQPSGTMSYSNSGTQLSGYHGCGTIMITYNIQPGTQTSDHPHPGRPFRCPGFPRTGYLPDNDEGRSILYLLIEAWKRRLIFTVGRSSTTGQDDVVTWTSIHHKTSTHSAGGHGYPDETYLERVRDELEAAGVVEDDQSS